MLTDAQRKASDPAQRKQIIDQIQELMLSDMVAAPLSHIAPQHNVLNPVVKNLETFHWTVGTPHLKDVWVHR
jgi:ABC-type transport system substrate-binding protein